MDKPYTIQFPPTNTDGLDQDKAFFYLNEGGEKKRIRFHDYDEIYSHPGLYEQIFYQRLKCQSPKKVAEIFKQAVVENQQHFSELRVLDLGAGNGIMGEVLKQFGVSRMVGLDIIPEAKEAAERDRSWVYDAYYVMDCCDLSEEEHKTLQSWSFDCLVSVAALGFGDIPPKAFLEAMRAIDAEGWLAFNIKETFLDNTDNTGFSRMIRELIFSEYMDIHHLERYWHRHSIEGSPLYYFAVVCKKTAEIPADFLQQYGIE